MSLLVLFLAFAVNEKACAEENIPCKVISPSGDNEKVTVTFFSDNDFVRIRFVSSSPDRYFSKTKGNSVENEDRYVEFASKRGSEGSIALEQKTTSILIHPRLIGGEQLTWEENDKKVMECGWAVEPWTGKVIIHNDK